MTSSCQVLLSLPADSSQTGSIIAAVQPAVEKLHRRLPASAIFTELARAKLARPTHRLSELDRYLEPRARSAERTELTKLEARNGRSRTIKCRSRKFSRLSNSVSRITSNTIG